MKHKLKAAAVLVLGMSLVQADTVNDQNVTTFQANTPARAAEVNSTIAALITAINDNASRIAALENATPDNSVAGSTYQVHTLNSWLAAGAVTGNTYNPNGPNDFVNVSHGTLSMVIQFASAGGTFTETSGAAADKEFGVNAPHNQYSNWTSDGEVIQGTYQQTNSTLTLTYPPEEAGEAPEEFTMTVSEDGSFGVGVVIEQGPEDFGGNATGEGSFIEIIIAVRTATSD